MKGQTPGSSFLSALPETDTVIQAIQKASSFLKRYAIASPQRMAEELVAHTLDIPRLRLYAISHQKLTARRRLVLAHHIRRAIEKEPLQYITGTAGFMGYDFKSDSRALIPRPETERLVERVLACEAVWAYPRPRIADIGTGSGCIAVTLAKHRPQGAYAGVDTSSQAITLARENAERLDVQERVHWHVGNLLSPLQPQSLNVVVANLPYIPTAAWAQLEASVRDYEPQEALDGGATGLSYIQELIEITPAFLLDRGRLFLEIDAQQVGDVTTLMTANGFQDIHVIQDLTGRDRIIEGTLP